MSRRRALPTFTSAAPEALANKQLRRNLRNATTTIRAKRAGVVGEMPDWEALREAGRAIKERALRHLDHYLTELEASVTRAGGRVHWARDAREANRIICDLVKAEKVDEVVKVKSITTDEIGMNSALEEAGVQAVETDLAELIIQLAGERSSHFLVPAIHKNRSEIRDLFRDKLGRRDLSDDPAELADAARLHLRRKFLSARVGISGANFAVAETGTVGVVESEGNGRMCLTLPRVLITLMGIEKVIPMWEDLEVFLQLLPRSATGERMNPYTSLWTGVTEGDGPQAFHLVLLDNGRTRVLADPVGREALYCIRCSACLNVCPVYSRVGGHAYNAVYPGPIGSILMPQLLGPGVHDSLPYASSLCGACGPVCPVKIRIPEILLHLRGRTVRAREESGGVSAHLSGERIGMKILAWILATPRRYGWAQRWGRRLQWFFMGQGRIRYLRWIGTGWTRGRDLRPIPRPTFREWWRKERGGAP